jgi:hypothetical protein
MPTFRAGMNSWGEWFLACMSPAIRTNLRTVFMVYLGKLRHLRMNFLQIRIFFLPLGQLPFLLQIVREGNVCRHDIFPIQRARRQRKFPTVNPVFEVAQTSVIQSLAPLQPLNHYRLLVSIWINSGAIVHRQNSSILSESMPNAKTWGNHPEYLLVSSSILSWILSYTYLHPHVLPHSGGVG